MNNMMIAIKCYKKALTIARELGDKDDERRLLESSASAYYRNEQHDNAIECYEKALTYTYQKSKQYQMAIECYKKALTIARESRDKNDERRLLELSGSGVLQQ